MIVASFRLIILVALVAAVTGCTDNTPAPVAAPPLLSSDEKVLRFLDYLDPMYKIDSDGRVVNLAISWRHLPTPVMAEIGKLTELNAAGFTSSTVTDDGLAQLRDLQKLKSLGLVGTQVTDKCLIHLEKLQSLQWVWLPKQSVTPQGKQRLNEVRPDMTIYLQ